VTSSTHNPSQTASLSPARGETDEHKTPLTCIFGGLNGRKLTLEFDERPAISGPVSIECNDALFLGEIIRVTQDGNGKWRVEVLVEQILTGLQNLLRFRASLLSEGVGPSVEKKPLLPVCA
jgi:hypothetical protein